MNTEKVCSRCKKRKDISFFYKGLSHCKSCESLLKHNYRIAHREERNAYTYKWRKSHPERTKEMYRNAYQSSPNSFIGRLWSNISGNKRGIEVGVTLNYLRELYVAQGGRCAVTGIKMDHKFKSLKAISVDRIDSSKGYVLENVHLVCKFINQGKMAHSISEVHDFLRDLMDTYSFAGGKA